MLDEQLRYYLNQTHPPKGEWVKELEEQAKTDHVPIMESVSMHFVMQIIRISKPKRILEIGTAIGYSALRMLEANPNTSIVTIERDEVRYQQALDNIQRLNKQHHIDVIYGDALEEISKLQNTADPFDLIFIDAAKGQYKRFFELSVPLLSNNGLIITDNVLFRGYVANPESSPKKYRNMVDKIKNYNDFLMSHSDFTTSIIPVGDGVALSYKT
ncbi:O-methyltransferase [Oceanobacillus salinisoli]|uniref:O-methyltransferase n=1 Tax=Oceanobacillus salinisoli TaxID=2678611 RepID=UPI0012E238A9|nr:O-methyltransferase [Oceanobacillus salinisoli]